MSGGVFLEVLSICYNGTDAFLVPGIDLIKYDRGFVILLVNLLVRLTVFRCFSVFHPLWVGLVPHCGCEYLLLGEKNTSTYERTATG